MLKLITGSRPARSRAARTVLLGGLSLTFVACKDAAAPSGPALRTPNAAAARSNSFAHESERIPEQYIVTFADNGHIPPGLAKQLVAQSNGTLLFTYDKAAKGFAARLSDDAVAALEHNPNIASIEPDQTVQAAGTQSPAPWYLDRLDQRTSALDNSFSWSNSGAGVTVYILDTGILISHPDLEGRASYGYDFVNNSTTADDCNGHGTHMAGLVGSARYGTAKGASLKSVRVLDCSGNGTTSAAIAGLDWVVANHVGPAVANLSFSSGFSSALNDAVARAIAAGVTVVVAAGDNGTDACGFSPASAPGAITVGAMITDTGVDAMMSFSNYGNCVDLFAPGYQIVSDWNNGQVWLLTGTSPSAPFAAGAAADYLEANPSASPSQVSAALLGSATSGVLAGLGSGSPNRLLYVGGGSAPPPPPPDTTPTPPAPAPNAAPTASFTATCQKASCSFNASASKDDNGIVRYDWTFGDGSTASSSSPTALHVYSAKGTYSMTVTLKVTDGGNLSNQTSKKITIKTGR